MEVTLANFVFYVVLATFTFVPVIAIGSRVLHYRVERRSLKNRVICRLCQHAFENSNRSPIVTCPACAANNEAGDHARPG